MTNHGLIFIAPLILIGLAVFAFFRFPRGARLINELRPKADPADANSWVIGPVLPGDAEGGGNQSKNMPLHPTAGDGGGFVIDMPTPESQPHYVTFDHGPLTGKSRITIKGRIEGGPFFAKDGTSQASLCLYFQRQFDDWAATIQFADPADRSSDLNQNTQYYRWFATGNAMLPMVAGPFELTASLTDKWTALQGGSEDSLNPHEGAPFFKGAIDNAGQVGFVLGGGDGWGHGIMATAPSKIIVSSFEIA